jgi:hypothetical protein
LTGLNGLTAGAPPAPRIAPPVPPATRERRIARRLGWIAAAAATGSVLLMAAVSAAGPSAVVPAMPRTWPAPPLWYPEHLSDATVTMVIYVALILGGAAVGCGLAAVRRGARPSCRLLLAAAAGAVAVLAVLPPAGSTDSLTYAAYGRIAATGHNPYVMTPHQLRASGDPVGREAPRNWQNDPSLYGPVATATEWAAARLGGTSISPVVFWLKLLYALAFGAIALALDRLLRRDQAARVRAHLLWTANPLMLWAVVAGAHVDGLGAGLGFLGLLIARPAGPLDATAGARRALAAGLLIGAAAGVKAPFALLGIALAWSLRRSPRAQAAAAAGAALVLVPGYLITGPAALAALVWRGSNLVTFDSFWRLFYPPFGFGAMPAGLEVIAAVGCLALAGLLAWRLPPGPGRLPAIRPALVLTLAWLLVWPLQRPWYDAIAFCLLAVVPASRLDTLMLIRAVPAAMAVATGIVVTPPPQWVSDVEIYIGYSLSPCIRLCIVIAAATLCLTTGWSLPQPTASLAKPGQRRRPAGGWPEQMARGGSGGSSPW